MKREFVPISKFPFYNDIVDRLMTQSQVLNGGSMRPNAHTQFFDRAGIISSLLEITGDENGRYKRNGESRLAFKPIVQMRLEEIEKRFKEYKRMRVNSGYVKPTVMPKEMLEEFYKYKARLTVLEAEEEELRKWLQTYTDKDEAIEDSLVLQYGLQGYSRLHGTTCTDVRLMNTLKEIDGMRVELTEEKLLIINDDRSPYSGMLVSDYRKLVNIYQEQRKQKEIEKFKLLQQSYREQNLPAPQQPPVMAPRKVSRGSLPPWPDWAKNYLLNETVDK